MKAMAYRMMMTCIEVVVGVVVAQAFMRKIASLFSAVIRRITW